MGSFLEKAMVLIENSFNSKFNSKMKFQITSVKDTEQGAHIFPDELINANEEHEEGMKYLCTHQFRPCDEQGRV